MKILFALSIFSLLAITVGSCYYDKEQLLYGVQPITCTDSTASSYTQKVVPVLQQNCYSCHSGNFPSGNIPMGSYQLDKVLAQNGKLMGTIKHSPGFKAMPQGQPKMNACQIAAIQKWIDSGMQNN